MKPYTEEDVKSLTLNAMISVMQEYSFHNESTVIQFHEEWVNEYIESLNDISINYIDEDIEKAYKAGQSGNTFYKKDGTVILPDNYQGVDG